MVAGLKLKSPVRMHMSASKIISAAGCRATGNEALKPTRLRPVCSARPAQGRVKIGDMGRARFIQSPLRPLTNTVTVVTIWGIP